MTVGDLGGERGEDAGQVGVQADTDDLVLDVDTEVVGDDPLGGGEGLLGRSRLSRSRLSLGLGRSRLSRSRLSLGLGRLQRRLRLRLVVAAGRGYQGHGAQHCEQPFRSFHGVASKVVHWAMSTGLVLTS